MIQRDTMVIKQEVVLDSIIWGVQVSVAIRSWSLQWFTKKHMGFCIDIDVSMYDDYTYIMDLCPLDKEWEERDDERIALEFEKDEMWVFVDKFALFPDAMFDWANDTYIKRAKNNQ